MKVIFDKVSDFLNELEREAGSRFDQDQPVQNVRITPKEQVVNNGTSEMFLRSGFLVGENLNELNQYCGETWQGDRSNTMTNQYKSYEKVITEFCKTKDIEVRGGEYDG